jgi:aspartate/methionine/tyrosine aminotransferase
MRKEQSVRFSSLVEASCEAVSIRYNNKVYELQRQGHDVTVLSLGEAFFDLPLFSFDLLPLEKIYHYSHSRGILELRAALAHTYAEKYQVPVDPVSEMLVTAGSKAAIHMAFMTILDRGDEVLIPEPAWVSYPEQVKLCGARPIGVPYWIDTFHLEEFVTPRTRAIVINTPHNPTGRIYSAAELEYLLELARRRDLWILSDEAYSEFTADDSFVSLGRFDPHKKHSILFNSISKNHGISGWRIGYVIAAPEVINRVLKINQHLITCPPTILCHYVARYYDRILAITRPQIRAVVEKRRRVLQHLDARGITYLPGTATFYIFASIAPSALGSEAFCTRLLEERLVSVVPGIGYGASCDGFIRIGVGTTSMEKLCRGLDAIKELIEETAALNRAQAA